MGSSSSASKVVPISTGGWSDQAIVDGLLKGDQAAGAALYERVHARVNQIVWRMLGADSEHDDIVHQVFLSALGNISSLRNAGSLESWMVGITLNTIKYEFRKRRIRRFFRPFETEYEEKRPHLDPEKQMLSRRFYESLDRLNSKDRLVFSLRFIEGYSLAETAEILGVSLSTVKRRIGRAKRAFGKQVLRDPFLTSWIKDSDNAG